MATDTPEAAQRRRDNFFRGTKRDSATQIVELPVTEQPAAPPQLDDGAPYTDAGLFIPTEGPYALAIFTPDDGAPP